jgi:hypothetical protein
MRERRGQEITDTRSHRGFGQRARRSPGGPVGAEATETEDVESAMMSPFEEAPTLRMSARDATMDHRLLFALALPPSGLATAWPAR